MLHTLGGLHLDGAARQQAGPLVLLAYLVLEGPQERRSVQELFFPGHTDAAGRLRMMLHRLKQAAPDAIETPGTRLQTPLPSDAAGVFRAAERRQADEVLALYRGRFLDGVRLPGGPELEEWVFATRERLTARVRSGHLSLGRAAALRGDSGAALTHAERAYLLPGAPEPDLDEAQLMALVLTAAGSAFAADARSEVRPASGPMPEQAAEALRALAGSAPATTVPPGTERRSGATRRRDEVADAPEPLAGSPPSWAAGVGPAEASLPTLLGREDALARLDASYADGARLVTVLGQGGMGKTLLARHVLTRTVVGHAAAQGRSAAARPLLPGLMVDLSTVTDESAVLAAIASASQARTASPEDVAQSVRAYDLLILDNFEQVVGAARQVAALLEAAPDLRVLVTSRERLHLEQEHVLPLRGLSLEVRPIGGGGPEQEGWSDAARLFVRRATRAHLGFVPHIHRAGIEQVCALLQGVPLLIELASAWVRTLSPADIAAQLDEGRTHGADLSEPDLGLLETRDRNVLPRHASARAVLEASWERLGTQDQALLARLAVFLSDFTVRAARQITGATLSGLANLTDKSWLGAPPTGAGGSGRLSWHPLARAFVREASGGWETGNWQQMLPAHAHHFAQGLDASRFQVEALADLLGEWPDIGQAARTLARFPEDWPTLIRLAREVPGWADQVGNYASVAGLIGRVLEALPTGASPRAQLLLSRAFMFKRMHRLRDSAADYRKAADLLVQSGDEQEVQSGLSALAVLHSSNGEYAQAQAIWLELLPQFRAGENRAKVAYTLQMLAVNAWRAGRFSETESWIREAIGIRRELPPGANFVQAHATLGLTLSRLGRFAEAHAAHMEGLRIAKEIQAVANIPELLNHVALNLLEMERAEDAVRVCLEALDRDQTNQPLLRADMLDTLALCYARTGQEQQARQALARSTQITVQLQDIPELLHRICTYTLVAQTTLSVSEHAGILHWLLGHEHVNADLKDLASRRLVGSTQPSAQLPVLDAQAISEEAQLLCGYHAGEPVFPLPLPL